MRSSGRRCYCSIVSSPSDEELGGVYAATTPEGSAIVRSSSLGRLMMTKTRSNASLDAHRLTVVPILRRLAHVVLRETKNLRPNPLLYSFLDLASLPLYYTAGAAASAPAAADAPGSAAQGLLVPLTVEISERTSRGSASFRR